MEMVSLSPGFNVAVLANPSSDFAGRSTDDEEGAET